MRTADFDYELPEAMIAQTPVEPRDAARLLRLGRADGSLIHTRFSELGEFLRAGDLLVWNDTRVIPARLFGRKLPGGGRVELLLLRKEDACIWEALGGGKGLQPGRRIVLEGLDGQPVDLQAEVVEVLSGARRLVRFDRPLDGSLDRLGHTPLPPYIHTPLADAQRYQTVYARDPGSAAAPTAGLHITPQLIERLQHMGVRFAGVTLHVGLDTFAPVNESDPRQHQIHSEWRHVSPETAAAVNATRQAGGRIIAVGTTSVRTLESAARQAGPGQVIAPVEGSTDLFILPPFEFKAVDGMITNFHLPRSTLLMLVSAFAGRERIMAAYEEAKREGYRFFSFGDAMLIV